MLPASKLRQLRVMTETLALLMITAVEVIILVLELQWTAVESLWELVKQVYYVVICYFVLLLFSSESLIGKLINTTEYYCSNGICVPQYATTTTVCDDNNDCTTEDHCSGIDNKCIGTLNCGDLAPCQSECPEMLLFSLVCVFFSMCCIACMWVCVLQVVC